MNWKEALLLSDMPLEFAAARVLVSEGFSVNSDFRYAWGEEETGKDAAVDLHGKLLSPFPESPEKFLLTEVLADCRHRRPDTVGIFLPDPNPPGTSPLPSGKSIRLMDQFSAFVMERDSIRAFDTSLPFCYKGLEVNLKSGETDENVFRKGLWHLQNPLPRLITDNILDFLSGPRENNRPFLFCPVLLTTSALYVMKADISMEEIERAAEVRELGEEVPWLLMYADMSPVFRKRCMDESARLNSLLRTEKAMEIEMRKARYYNSRIHLPFTIIDALNAADYYYMSIFFSRFVICNYTRFAELIRKIKKTALTALSTLEEVI